MDSATAAFVMRETRVGAADAGCFRAALAGFSLADAWARSMTFGSARRGESSSLSPGERAGVRGKDVLELDAPRVFSKPTTSRAPNISAAVTGAMPPAEASAVLRGSRN